MKLRALFLVSGSLIALVTAALARPGRSAADGAPADRPAAARLLPAAAIPGATTQARRSTGKPLRGDASLRDALDLGKLERDGDHFVARMDSGRVATLTLDPALQDTAEAVLGRAKAHRGAVVVMSIDGRILALAGRDRDTRDPRVATKVWAPAASVFKIVTAAALIDSGVRPDRPVCYHGGVDAILASNLTDDPRQDVQCDDLGHAIAASQNAIIAKLAHQHLQPGQLRTVARAFGFDRLPEFALPVEPSRADIPDGDLDFARVSAGFWRTELSPLGGALVASTVATGGLAVTPRIVAELSDDRRLTPVEAVPPRRVLAEHIARDLAHIMVGTTEHGTARKGFYDDKGRAFLPSVPVAGKTGTLTQHSPHYMQFSWFVGFAPADNPEIVIAVLLGNPEKWHLKAHTAARIVLQKALRGAGS